MRKLFFFTFILLFTVKVTAQVSTDSIAKKEISEEENDTIVKDPILLEEVVVYRSKLSPEEKKQFLLLQNRVYKVYPCC